MSAEFNTVNLKLIKEYLKNEALSEEDLSVHYSPELIAQAKAELKKEQELDQTNTTANVAPSTPTMSPPTTPEKSQSPNTPSTPASPSSPAAAGAAQAASGSWRNPISLIWNWGYTSPTPKPAAKSLPPLKDDLTADLVVVEVDGDAVTDRESPRTAPAASH